MSTLSEEKQGLKISVVTIVLNRRDMLKKAIDSVLAQKYPNFEHIIIDGGSTDGTLEMLQDYPHLRVVSEPDDGQADAMNKGLRMMTGDVFAWLNSDDTYPENAFSIVNRYFTQYPDVSMVYGTCRMVNADLETIGHTNFHKFNLPRMMMGYNNVNTPAVFVRTSALAAVGEMDLTLRATYDLDMWIRIARQGKVMPVRETLSNLCLHEGSGLVSTRHHIAERKVLFNRYRKEVPAFDFYVKQIYYALKHFAYDKIKFNAFQKKM